MKKLAKMGAIGFGLFAFSELFGTVGEAQAYTGLIVSGAYAEDELYNFLDECISVSDGYSAFKIKLIKRWTKALVKTMG